MVNWTWWWWRWSSVFWNKHQMILWLQDVPEEEEKIFFAPEAGVDNVEHMAGRWPWHWRVLPMVERDGYLGIDDKDGSVLKCQHSTWFAWWPRWQCQSKQRLKDQQPIIKYFLLGYSYCYSLPPLSVKAIGQCTIYFPQKTPLPPPLALPTDANATLRLEARFQGRKFCFVSFLLGKKRFTLYSVLVVIQLEGNATFFRFSLRSTSMSEKSTRIFSTVSMQVK